MNVTKYTLLPSIDYFALNNSISEAKGYTLGDATERLSAMNPQLAKVNIQENEGVESYDLACILAIEVDVQELYPELIDGLIFTNRHEIVYTDDQVNDLHVGSTSDWALQHYNAVGRETIDAIHGEERTDVSDIAVDSLKQDRITVITKSENEINRFVVVTKDEAPVVSEFIDKGTVETIEQVDEYENLDIPSEQFDDLPDTGYKVYKDKMYNYNDQTVLCIQTHIRTIYPPEQTPALFSFYREETEDMEWIINEAVEVDFVRIYNEVSYTVIQSHMTQQSWNPEATLNVLWVETPGGEIPVWQQPAGGHDAYNTGDQVYFPTANDDIYESLIDGNVWSPTGYPAGWQLI